MIPKSDHSIPLVSEPLGPYQVWFFIFGMLPPVDFDNQFPLETNEVNDEIPYRLLSSEFEIEKLSGPQMRPKPPFGICRFFP